MPYTPPTSPLTIDFLVTGYNPELSPITFEFIAGNSQNVEPSGIAPPAVPDPLVYNLAQFVSPGGTLDDGYGSPLFATDLFVYASGMGIELVGTPLLAYDQEVSISGAASLSITDPLIARQIQLNFTTAYTPSLPLDFDFLGDAQGVLAAGFDAAQFGTAFIAHQNREIYPFGFSVLGIGGFYASYTQTVTAFGIAPIAPSLPTVYNATTVVTAAGIQSLAVASPVIYNETREIRPWGGTPLETGSPSVMLADRYVTVTVGALGFVSGTHGVSNNPHFIFANGTFAGAIGAATFYGGTQTIRVTNQFTEAIGVPFVGDANRNVTPSGISSLLMSSTHVVRDSAQPFTPAGIAGTFGSATIYNLDRRLFPEPVLGSVPQPVVFNSTQVVTQLPPPFVDGHERTGRPTFENYWKEIRPAGVSEMNVYLSHSVIEVRTHIYPAGFSDPRFGDAYIQNSNFYKQVQGVPPPAISANHAVSNVSAGVLPAGADTLSIGSHAFAPTIRASVSGFQPDVIGQAWVSHSPRSITLTPFYRIDSLQFGAAFVSNSPRYVQVAGVPPDFPGYPAFSRVLLRILPQGYYGTETGRPSLANQNRRILVEGLPPRDPGAVTFDLSWKYAATAGFDSSAVGAHRVADQTQQIRCEFPTFTPIVTQHGTALLYKVPGDPPGTQTVTVNMSIFGSLGTIVVRGDSIRPEGIGGPESGTPSVRSFGIFPEGIREDNVADTLHRIVAQQIITVTEGVKPAMEESSSLHDTKHRTIWATSEVTQQIRDNHPGPGWRPVDSELEEARLVGVGTPRASNFNREIVVPGGAHASFGNATLTQFSPFIRPVGVPPPRTGMPRFIWRNTIDLAEYSNGIFSEQFGDHAVSFWIAPGTPGQISPAGIQPNQVPQHRISNFEQVIQPAGVSPLAFGQNQFNLPLPPKQVSGALTESIGAAFVSNFIREIDMSGRGVDALDMWETIGDFRRRMRIYSVASRSASGFDSASIGSAWVSSSVQQVLAGSIQPGTVPGPTLGIQLESVGGGQPFATLGTVRVDLVEEGKIKPYGIYPNDIAKPSLLRAISPQGIEGDVGDAVLGQLAQQSQLVSLGVGAPVFVFSDNVGHHCGMASRAVAVQGISSAAVPEPAL